MHLRKAHYGFGWDWGAHLPDAGIFRPVSLLGISTARIDNVLILQEHERTGETEPGTVRPITKSVTLTFQVEQETVGDEEHGPALKDVTCLLYTSGRRAGALQRPAEILHGAFERNAQRIRDRAVKREIRRL